MKKILFCDMDGTIIDEAGLLYSKDKVLLEKYRGNGDIFVFNTGRNIEEAKIVINEHCLSYDYLVLNNGAHIVDKNDTVLYKRVISKEVGVSIIEHCLKYNNLWIYFFDGKTTLGYYQGQTYQYSSHGIIKCKDYNFLNEYPKVTEFDIIAIHQDNKKIENVLKVQEYVAKKYSVDAQGTLNQHFLDITPSNCSKGLGITKLVSLINEDLISYAIGDSYNDISMFEHADHGYTFNHVSDEIKMHSSNQVDNLSELIENILQGGKINDLAR